METLLSFLIIVAAKSQISQKYTKGMFFMGYTEVGSWGTHYFVFMNNAGEK